MGSPNIGVYCLATDCLALVPTYVSDRKLKRIEDLMGVDGVRISLGGSILNGALAAANSRGIVIPRFADSEDERILKSAGFSNVARLDSVETAFGNLVLANDFGGVCDPELRSPVISTIEDVLDIELVSSTIAGLPYVGALAVANNKGVVVHPLLKQDEKRILEDILGVPATEGTTNGGVPIVKSGMLANSRAALVGSQTTGPELVIIGQAFGLTD